MFQKFWILNSQAQNCSLLRVISLLGVYVFYLKKNNNFGQHQHSVIVNFYTIRSLLLRVETVINNTFLLLWVQDESVVFCQSILSGDRRSQLHLRLLNEDGESSKTQHQLQVLGSFKKIIYQLTWKTIEKNNCMTK